MEWLWSTCYLWSSLFLEQPFLSVGQIFRDKIRRGQMLEKPPSFLMHSKMISIKFWYFNFIVSLIDVQTFRCILCLSLVRQIEFDITFDRQRDLISLRSLEEKSSKPSDDFKDINIKSEFTGRSSGLTRSILFRICKDFSQLSWKLESRPSSFCN